MEYIRRCEECLEEFNWDDQVVNVEGNLYHDDCIELYSNGFVAFDVSGNFLGETETEGSMAYDVLEEGEYIDDDS